MFLETDSQDREAGSAKHKGVLSLPGQFLFHSTGESGSCEEREALLATHLHEDTTICPLSAEQPHWLCLPL